MLPGLRIVTTTGLSGAELRALRTLLNSAFDDDFSNHDWDHCLGGRHVILSDGDGFISHAAVVERLLIAGDQTIRTGYVEGVATRPPERKQGHGSRVMDAIAEIVRNDFELGALATGRPGFYARLGWELWRGPTSVTTARGPQRTPEEDGAVMILRTQATSDLDLTVGLMCERRVGDAW
ncbi:MAG: GNAT family N-acetyltransferase [Actinomycetota bacterium]|nr:GNAT family N-acetyltransferase [Actinomycetota bacterium]